MVIFEELVNELIESAIVNGNIDNEVVSPAHAETTDSSQKEQVFKCLLCKRELPIKYRHNGFLCADCVNSGKTSEGQDENGVNYTPVSIPEPKVPERSKKVNRKNDAIIADKYRRADMDLSTPAGFFEELVNEYMDSAVENGYTDPLMAYSFVENFLRGYNYSKGELSRLVFEYKVSHPDIFPDYLTLCEIESRIDDYSSEGVWFSYLLPKHQLFSQNFYSVAGGCGHGGSGTKQIATWERLLEVASGCSGRWNEENWKKVCDDFEQHPELKCAAFEELKELRSGRADKKNNKHKSKK